MQDDDYLARLVSEKSAYRDCAKVHDLPQIFHYWSNKYVRPKLEALGFSTPNEMFLKYLEEQCKLGMHDAQRFASIGSGNCDLEIALASQLRSRGWSGFVVDCLDLNAAMLERGRAAAVKGGVEEHINFVNA